MATIPTNSEQDIEEKQGQKGQGDEEVKNNEDSKKENNEDSKKENNEDSKKENNEDSKKENNRIFVWTGCLSRNHNRLTR